MTETRYDTDECATAECEAPALTGAPCCWEHLADREAFVEGLEMRVQWGIPNEHTVSLARHIADEGLGYKAKASNIASRAETKMEKEAAARERWRVMTGEKKPVGGDVEEDEEKKIKKTE